jgi:hypothetical protein
MAMEQRQQLITPGVSSTLVLAKPEAIVASEPNVATSNLALCHCQSACRSRNDSPWPWSRLCASRANLFFLLATVALLDLAKESILVLGRAKCLLARTLAILAPWP